MYPKVKLRSCQVTDVVKARLCRIEKAAAATAALMPSSGQNSMHPHPTTTPSSWQGFRGIFTINHPDFTHQIITNSIKYI